MKQVTDPCAIEYVLRNKQISMKESRVGCLVDGCAPTVTNMLTV